MGIEIATTRFDVEQRQRFSKRVESQLSALQTRLASPGFGAGPRTIGAELELYIVDGHGHASPCNGELQAAVADPTLTLELNRYNLEYNLPPFDLAEGGLRATEAAICERLETLSSAARSFDARIVPIGILPTLRREDFGRSCITDRQRYHALVEQLLLHRGSHFTIDISGPEPLHLRMDDITLEGANTSFQVHLRVPTQRYADVFNALQMVTPLGLAVAANSPGLFGHRLWEETRVPLFKQSIDSRREDRYHWNEPARVFFGHGWVRHGAGELFEEAVRFYPPLLPACAEASPAAGELPELQLHLTTVWQWNRPVYDAIDGGHLRIELRALPAGPSAVDMVANAALLIGLAEGLSHDMRSLTRCLPFALAEYNFYRAAQHGLDARVVWPAARQQGLSERPIIDVIAESLPVAADGLAALGVSAAEVAHYLGVIEGRLAARTNGARWQRKALEARGACGPWRERALAGVLERYLALSHENRPVAEWAS